MTSLDFGENNRSYDVNRPQYYLASQLLKHINVEGETVLDIGCGMGEFMDLLNQKKAKCVGVDGTKNCCDFVSEKGYKCYNVDLENQKLPFKDGTFDVVVSLDVIEHLWNTELYLSEMQRVLKRGGYAILTTPNYNYYKYRVMHLLGNFEKFTFGNRHKKFYTVNSFRKELENYFRIKKTVANLPKLKIHTSNKNFMCKELKSYLVTGTPI
jgi:methionine biosynthesis protein MetW